MNVPDPERDIWNMEETLLAGRNLQTNFRLAKKCLFIRCLVTVPHGVITYVQEDVLTI